MLHDRQAYLDRSRCQTGMQWICRRGVPSELPRTSPDPDRMQNILRERTSMQEYILLQERVVQPLGHALQKDEVEQEGGYLAPVDLCRGDQKSCRKLTTVRWTLVPW